MANTQSFLYVVEPVPAQRERIERAFASLTMAVISVDGARAFFDLQQVETHGCVLVELELTDMPILDFVAAAARILPVIVIGRADDLGVAVEVMRAGATNFLDRPCDDWRLRAAVRAAIKTAPP